MARKTRFNITLDPGVHQAALKALKPMGITLSGFINMILKQAFLQQPEHLEDSLKQVTMGFLELVPSSVLAKKALTKPIVQERVEKDIKKEVKRVNRLTKK